jgi:hypothetical protein
MMWERPLVHLLVPRCVVAIPYKYWFVAPTKSHFPWVTEGNLTHPSLSHLHHASVVQLHLSLSKESHHSELSLPGTMKILSYCVFCLHNTLRHKTCEISLIPFVNPPRVLPKSNLDISWMRGTATVLTWKLGSTKDTSPRLCLFTQSIPILCSRIRASHTLTLRNSLVYLDSLLTILTFCHSDVQWKNTRNITNTYIVQATPMVPNTWVGLLYCET